MTDSSDEKNEKKQQQYYVSKENVVPQKQNPWSETLVQTMKRGRRITGFASVNTDLVNRDTGETTDAGAVVGQSKIVDKEEFIKFFGTGLIQAFDLSKTAKDVFLTILHAYIEKNTIAGKPDQIFINHSVAKDELGYKKSRATFTSGINELCTKEFMAPVQSRNGFYWLNPNLFYKGDRMRIITEYKVGKVEKKPEKKLEELPDKSGQDQE